MTCPTCTCVSHNGFLTAKGLVEAAQRDVIIDGVAGMDMFSYLDSRVSVSAPTGVQLHWPDDHKIDQQYRRFLSV